MKILSVFDAEFTPYGTVLEGYDFSDLIKELEQTECPKDSVVYV